MVELDQFKSILATYTEPLVEVRDSLLTWLMQKKAG